MKLYGQFDSPFVRRVAISMAAYGIEFEQIPYSVFSDFERWRDINPAVKAPTLEMDNGMVLMESSLILEYFEALAIPEHKLLPQDSASLAVDMRTISLALIACEKTVQVVYEHNLRPAEKQHQPWLDRVNLQLNGALSALQQQPLSAPSLSQAQITTAVAWQFIVHKLKGIFDTRPYNELASFSEQMEMHEFFQRLPFPLD